MSAQDQGGRWEKCSAGECETALNTAARYNVMIGGYERWIPAPDARDAEIARLHLALERVSPGILDLDEAVAHASVLDKAKRLNAEIAELKAAIKRMCHEAELSIVRIRERDERVADVEAEIASLKAQLADKETTRRRIFDELVTYQHARDTLTRERDTALAQLAAATKPVSVPGRPNWIESQQGSSPFLEQMRTYALALEGRVRKLEAG